MGRTRAGAGARKMRGGVMEDQHKYMIGYRDLSAAEVALINEIKTVGNELGELVKKLRARQDIDQRWVSEGNTDLQKGIMLLTRAVAKPTSF